MNILEQYKYTLDEEGYFYLGSNIENVEEVFTKGLETKNNSLYNNTYSLTTGENFQKFLKTINNFGTGNIAILKLPIEYINIRGSIEDINNERFFPFYVKNLNQENKEVNYVDKKFIYGVYDSNNNSFYKNPNYKEEYSEEEKQNLQQKLLDSKEIQLSRLRLNDTKIGYLKGEIPINKEDHINDSENYQENITSTDIKNLNDFNDWTSWNKHQSSEESKRY